MDYDLRPISDDDVTAFGTQLNAGFGHDFVTKDADRLRRYLTASILRTFAVFDGDQVVGTIGDFKLDVTVPGGAQLAMAGTTMVTVRQTHRRQGILRAMIHEHLRQAVERSEPLAGLWASEAAIYGRFGFGLATELHDVSVNAKQVVFPRGRGVRTEQIKADDLQQRVAPLWSQVARRRAGFIDRDETRWLSIADDPEHRREGASSLRHVVATRNGEVVGYTAFRQKPQWQDGGVATGTVNVEDLIAADIEAYRGLWNFVTNIDLFPLVHFWNRPVDDPVMLEASDPRGLRRIVSDALFVRILDLPAALSARTYETDGDVVMAISDELGYAAGNFRLTVVDGRATIVLTNDEPTVALHVRDLGALYLGRSVAPALAKVGRIQGEPADIGLMGQLFRTADVPWCSEEF